MSQATNYAEEESSSIRFFRKMSADFDLIDAITILANKFSGFRCGECSTCTRDTRDCMICINCMDKPKYGGMGVRKKACKNRKLCLRQKFNTTEGAAMILAHELRIYLLG